VAADLKEKVDQNEGRMGGALIGWDSRSERQRAASARTSQFTGGTERARV